MRARQAYKDAFAAFFALVTAHASQDLTFLSFRLDFNLFYEAELKDDAAAEPDEPPPPPSPAAAAPPLPPAGPIAVPQAWQ